MMLAFAVSLFLVGVINDLWGWEASRKALPFMLSAGLAFYLTTLIYPEIFLFFIGPRTLFFYGSRKHN
jgi:hypothetical protein